MFFKLDFSNLVANKYGSNEKNTKFQIRIPNIMPVRPKILVHPL